MLNNTNIHTTLTQKTPTCFPRDSGGFAYICFNLARCGALLFPIAEKVTKNAMLIILQTFR